MADEAEGRQVAEEVKPSAEGNGEPQEPGVRGGHEGNRSPVSITVDSVVDAFFASEEGPEQGSAGNGRHGGVSHQDRKNIEEWSSDDDDQEVRAHAPDIDSDDADDELQAQPVDGGDGSQSALDSGRKSPEDQQQAMAEAEHGPEEIQIDDGKGELSDAEPAQSPTTIEQKRDIEDHSAESPDKSADEEEADGEGNQGTPESSPARVASPVEAIAMPPVEHGQNSDQDEETESKDGKAHDQNHTEESYLELGSEPDVVITMDDFAEPKDVHVVAEDLIQDVLDKVITAETGTNGENTAAGQETEPKAEFSELDKVDMNSETWGSEGPALDNASLSNSDADMDREQDTEKLPSDSEQVAEADGDVKDGETGSGVDLGACEGEIELQGDSQQLYQYTSDHSQSAASSPRSQVSDEVQDSRDKPSVPAPTYSSDVGRSLPQQSLRPAQDHPSARDRLERPQEAEESHDGSYLWLQRQVQWRAGSSELPAVKGSRESLKSDRHVSSPGSGYGGSREEMRGDSSRQDMSGEGRLGMSTSVSTDVSGSMTSPGAIPNFNTLRDQQVSWLSMYRMLEEQHRTQLQAQYTEHQQMINDMQRHLEGELLSQQQSMRQKLDSHREALRDTSSYSASSRTQGSSSWYNRRSEGDLLPPSDQSSSLQQKETYSMDAGQSSSRDSKRSPEMSREKRLRGGVYSSPMPTAKFRTSARERSSYESSHPEPYTGNLSSERRSQRQEEDYDSDSRQLSTQTLSPRTHQSLREKHTKHLSDLRSYYEAEIQDLRQKLSAEGLRPSSSSSVTSARERIVHEENQMLRLQLRDLQDSLDDSHIYSRDLEQKLQGLEIRASDYAKRYEESQKTVLSLKNRLEELHSYAKDRESVLEQAQANERKQSAALQEYYKAKQEEEERSRRDTATIKRLLDKYELLEKDYSALKDTSADFEQKLFDTRSEGVQLNKVISQLELENKRLTHDSDNMRHRLAISGSLPITRQELAETEHRRSYDNLNGYTADSHTVTHPHSARSRDTTPPRRVLSDEEEAALGKSDSPLLRAERELRRLQQTLDHGEFIPRLQPKKYTAGSLCPASGEVTIIDAFSSPTRSGSGTSLDTGPKEGVRRVKKTVSSQTAKRDRPGTAQTRQTSGGRSPQKSSFNADSGPTASISSPTRFDVGVSQTGVRSGVNASAVGKKGRSREAGGDRKEDAKPTVKSVSKGSSGDTQRVDSALERIRSGQLVSRPQWEDVYTSLAKPAQPDKTSSLNMTQEEMLRDRIRSIDQMEKRYDALQIEKRKLESQLNKVPAHGRDRKSRREKELLEETLDNVDHELGSLRMTLKRYQVLKTTM